MAQPESSPRSPRSVEPGWYGADPEDPKHLQDPFPGFDTLRETQPVNRTPWGNWRISRYDDCVRLLREVPCGMRRTDGLLPGQAPEDPVGPPSFMLLQDPPVHTRLRKLVSKAFTPRAIESWRPRIEAITHERLDGVAERGSMDLIRDLALPVPATLICELMGVPVEDRDTFTEWTADATHGLVTARGGSPPPEIVERVDRARGGLAGYFNQLIDRRRGHPSDDLLSVLIAAEEDGDKLSQPELLTNCIGLLIAGFETTIGLIGNGLTALLRHPSELEKLRAQPELLASAVEECLRYAGPILMTVRILHADAEFDGIEIPCNDEITVMLAAANRDPRRFDEPERFDIERYARNPAAAPHLAFGGGVHHCLGAHLARLESQIAIGALVDRFDDLTLVDEHTQWGRSLFMVPASVPVTFNASAR